MRKWVLIIGFFFFMSSSVAAFEWSYPFLVYDGRVYKVTNIEINPQELGKQIGEVKTKPYAKGNSDQQIYYGNASNAFAVGTPYYEILGTSTTQELAVKDEEKWLLAVYEEKAPFHVMNVLMSGKFIGTVLTVVAFIAFGLWKKLYRERHE